jgi:hypothetical protein
MRNPTTAGLALLGVAVAAFGGPFYAVVRWISVWDSLQPRDVVLDAFMAGFPDWVASPRAISWISIGLCTLAGGAAFPAQRLLAGRLRAIAIALLVLVTVVGAWNLFTLM